MESFPREPARRAIIAGQHGGIPCAAAAGMQKIIQIEQHSATGLLWFAGWLFTIGFMHLTFWKGVAALLVWPYFMGLWVAGMIA